MLSITTKEKLNKALKFIERICKKNLNLPILENVLIEADDSNLILSGTNLENALVWKFLAKNEKKGKTCVPVKIFSDIISKVPEGQITLQTKDNFLYLNFAKSEIKIKTFNADDYPVIPLYKKETPLIFNSEILLSALSKTVNIPSQSISTPEFTGVLMSFKENNIYFVATDRFRLVEKKVNYHKVFDKKVNLILPQPAVREMINIFSSDGEIEMYFNPNQIWIRKEDKRNFEEIIFTSRLISGEFPEYGEILPKEEDYKTIAYLNKDEFVSFLKLGSSFYGKLNQVNLKFLPKENEIEISAQDPDVGEYQGKVKANISGEEIEIFLNYKFLLEGINLIEGEEMKIYLIDDEKPVLIKGQDENLIYIVMPIKAV